MKGNAPVKVPFLNTLSGRFLVLTVLFVMLAEVLIFVPSVARFREDYLLLRLERAQIASLSLLADDMIAPELEAELLQNAEVYNVVLIRDAARQLMLSSTLPSPVEDTYDMRDASAWELIRDAIFCLGETENKVIRVIGEPVQKGGLQIEVTMDSAPLKTAMLDYGMRILALSAFISVITAGMLFFAVRILMVRPIMRVVDAMKSYADAPEDARRVISPDSGIVELRQAEEALQSMQMQLTGALRQKERLAQLGGAVAKISHDLRNILTTAQLFTDRMETSQDPAVRRAVPKLIGSMSRAVNLCESTLSFGKAEEPSPRLDMFRLADLVEDVIEGEKLALGDAPVVFDIDVPGGMMLRADPEQLHRVLSNLVRNARQALAGAEAGRIAISAREAGNEWVIEVDDNGPGLPEKARAHLFEAFQGGARAGGSGLGLAIAAELMRGHGGRLDLVATGPDGTRFALHLPKAMAMLDAAAE